MQFSELLKLCLMNPSQFKPSIRACVDRTYQKCWPQFSALEQQSTSLVQVVNDIYLQGQQKKQGIYS